MDRGDPEAMGPGYIADAGFVDRRPALKVKALWPFSDAATSLEGFLRLTRKQLEAQDAAPHRESGQRQRVALVRPGPTAPPAQLSA